MKTLVVRYCHHHIVISPGTITISTATACPLGTEPTHFRVVQDMCPSPGVVNSIRGCTKWYTLIYTQSCVRIFGYSSPPLSVPQWPHHMNNSYLTHFAPWPGAAVCWQLYLCPEYPGQWRQWAMCVAALGLSCTDTEDNWWLLKTPQITLSSAEHWRSYLI